MRDSVGQQLHYVSSPQFVSDAGLDHPSLRNAMFLEPALTKCWETSMLCWPECIGISNAVHSSLVLSVALEQGVGR